MVSSVELEEIVKNCQLGRPEAWTQLVSNFAGRIFNMAFRFTGNREEAEDLTQEVFVKLWTSLPAFDFQKNFTPWFLTLAKNHFIDAYRKDKMRKSLREDFEEHRLSGSSQDNPETAFLKEENYQIIQKQLLKLSPEMRMVIILRDIQDKSYEEISEILSLPLGTVKSRVNRARLQLANNLQAIRYKHGGLT